jgi:hypothetical protein
LRRAAAVSLVLAAGAAAAARHGIEFLPDA